MKKALLLNIFTGVLLAVSMTGTDADFVVKLIDVYPPDEPATKATPKNVQMGGYQQMGTK